MMLKLKELVKDEAGQGMTEYGLIIALIAVVVIGALSAIGTNLVGRFTAISNELDGTPTN
ncbi:Flp family type IVb pilin [Paradesulfitobacterium ferrireducens]|uniref:Flp family type IVb pilin n=1 Tax=Paradesulfitobacterium ferrireducens TaxID=2816476 RepID=UPI001A8E61A3|nr:Flp family type IVb pilin [Paradesulfitobacterium ferrireducens]